VSERAPSAAEAAAEAAAEGGVARHVWTTFRQEVLAPPSPRITLVELHASYHQRDHARTHAALQRVARALAAAGASSGDDAVAAQSGHEHHGLRVARMHSDTNYVPQPAFEMPTCVRPLPAWRGGVISSAQMTRFATQPRARAVCLGRLACTWCTRAAARRPPTPWPS
jgi:hypothetical protein